MLADGPFDEAALGPGRRLRFLLLGAGGLLLLLALLPPLATLAGRYAVWEAFDYCLLAYVVPVLVVLAAPWSLRGEGGRGFGRLAFVRQRHRGQLRAFGFVTPFVLAIVGWRVPAAVDAVVAHRWLVVLEAATLLPTGVLAWLELIASPPLTPRSPRPRRIVLAALPMWTTWIMAFSLGFSRSDWFRAFDHLPGQGLSLIADQQLTAGVLWFIPFCVFVPFEFTNIIRWLRGGDDPDMELRVLLRGEGRELLPRGASGAAAGEGDS